jgi:hypothetical protein
VGVGDGVAVCPLRNETGAKRRDTRALADFKSIRLVAVILVMALLSLLAWLTREIQRSQAGAARASYAIAGSRS